MVCSNSGLYTGQSHQRKGNYPLDIRKHMKKIAALTVCCAAVFCLAGCGQAYQADRAPQEASSAPQASTEGGTENTYTAVIEVENYGSITVELDAAAAPETVENFVALAKDGFYDGLTFHRIMDGFMIQGGDPNGNGTGGSGTTIKGEFQSNGVENPLSHTRGAISMARSNDPDSASSQFFIVHEDSTYLDGDYAVFGYVTDGMDVVDAICADAKPTDRNGSIAKNEQPVISSVVVEKSEKR
jgi:peptidyl-prolyl cis-trans isomerase B (cyclophilin B)